MWVIHPRSYFGPVSRFFLGVRLAFCLHRRSLRPHRSGRVSFGLLLVPLRVSGVSASSFQQPSVLPLSWSHGVAKNATNLPVLFCTARPTISPRELMSVA